MIANIPAWASPATTLSSWVFAQLEQHSLLPAGAPVREALHAAKTPSLLAQAFAQTAETPAQTLWRVHRFEISPRLPARNVLLDRAWNKQAQSLPEAERLQQYADALSTILVMGAQIFSTKPDSVSWNDVYRVEKRLEEAQAIGRQDKHLGAVRGITQQVAALGFKARAGSLYREEIRMTDLILYKPARLSHLLKLSAAISQAGLGGDAVPLFRELIVSAKDYPETPSFASQLASDIARAGLGSKAARLFGMLIEDLRASDNDVVRARAVLGISMAIASANLGDLAPPLLQETTGIAELIANPEIRREALADLSRLPS